MVMQAEKVMSGSYGYMYHEGEWMTNITQAQASVAINKEEVPRAGTRWIGDKAMSVKGTGSMTGYKMTPTLNKRIGQFLDDKSPMFVTELIMKLDDPDSPETKQRVRLKGVQFDVVNIMQYEVGTIVTEETPFTFSGREYLD
ncbi:phage tail tube protein [Psychrobacillus sp. FSL K6-1267]|uniref:phage tail tube protein n=1 Tax=Psychrobacillus sp. FSL K6-1267 TaxID=2921543 RepID=UPI0030F79CFB